MKLDSRFALLKVVTDPAFMRERIESCLLTKEVLSAPIESIAVPRVMPRKSGEVLIQYQIASPGIALSDSGRLTLYAEFFPQGVASPPLAAADRARVHEFGDLCLRLWLFPSDPNLAHIRTLFDTSAFRDVYGDALMAAGLNPPEGELHTEALGYRLGRRFVARLSWTEAKGAPETHVVAKMCRPRQALSLWTRHRQLEHECLAAGAGQDVFLPRQLLIEETTGAVFQTMESGLSLHDMIGQSAFVEGCRTAMHVLNALRRFHITGLPVYTVREEIEHLSWLTAETTKAIPNADDDLQALLTGLRRRAPEDTVIPVICHRDFYDKQILYDADRAVLIDYDTLAESDPALDLGNFLAHLQWRAYQNPSASDTLTLAEAAVWESIGGKDSRLIERVLWWQASACLRLSCIYLWRPRWNRQASVFLADQVRRRPRFVDAF